MTYYNTTKESGATLTDYTQRAMNQDEVVLEVLRDAKQVTPSGIQAICKARGYNYPLTSIRRSLNTLTKLKRAEKTDKMRLGSFGRKVHTWKAL